MTRCKVCGMPTTDGPVCFDLRCEETYFGFEEAEA